MATSEEKTKGLDLRGPDDDVKRARAFNMGGESNQAVGAPVIISGGILIPDEVEHQLALKAEPPTVSVPAQDPHAESDEVPVGTAKDIPARGGPGQVRRVHDRTPSESYPSAAAPYNSDAGVVQRGAVQGTDAAEETAEGKRTPGGAREKVAEEARDEQAKARPGPKNG
jgi:hypothetical protein